MVSRKRNLQSLHAEGKNRQTLRDTHVNAWKTAKGFRAVTRRSGSERLKVTDLPGKKVSIVPVRATLCRHSHHLPWLRTHLRGSGGLERGVVCVRCFFSLCTPRWLGSLSDEQNEPSRAIPAAAKNRHWSPPRRRRRRPHPTHCLHTQNDPR